MDFCTAVKVLLDIESNGKHSTPSLAEEDGWLGVLYELGAACLEEHWGGAARAKASCVYRSYINPWGLRGGGGSWS